MLVWGARRSAVTERAALCCRTRGLVLVWGAHTSPHNLACNSPTLLSNIEIRTLIFRGFQGARQEVLRGIACEIWGGSSTEPADIDGIDGVDRFYQGTQSSSGRPQRPPPRPPQRPALRPTQRRPKRRPPLLKPSKYSHYGRGGLHFGQIVGEGHPHQHAAADTTSPTESTTPHPSARSSCQHHDDNRRLTSE